MSTAPPQNDDPSSRYSFDDPTPNQSFGGHVAPQQPVPDQTPRRRSADDSESLGETILEEVDETLGISQRLLGCSWWLLTLPFRLIWKVIGLFTDAF